MPIDFSILKQTSMNQQGSMDQWLNLINTDRQLKQQEQNSQRQFSVQNDQNMINKQNADQTGQYQQGVLSNQAATLEQQKVADANQAQYQQGLLGQGKADLEQRKIEGQDLNAYRGATLEQSAKDSEALNKYRQDELALRGKDIDRLAAQFEKTHGLDIKKFNLDNSKNLLDMAITMRDQAMKEKRFTNEQLSQETQQQYLQEVMGAKSAEEQQKIAMKYNRLDDAKTLAEEAQKAKNIVDKENMQAFGVGVQSALMQVATEKDPKKAGEITERALHGLYEAAVSQNNKPVMNALKEIAKIESVEGKLSLLAQIGGYHSNNAATAFQNPSAVGEDKYKEAQASVSESNPYMYNNLNPAPQSMSTAGGAQGVARSILGGGTTVKEEEKKRELKQARINDLKTKYQSEADQAAEYAQLSQEMLDASKRADESAGGTLLTGYKPGVDYEALGTAFGKDFGSLGGIVNIIREKKGLPENSEEIDLMTKLRGKMTLNQMGKNDKNDAMIRGSGYNDLYSAQPGPQNRTEEHEVFAKKAEQQAFMAQAKSEAFSNFIANGGKEANFNSQWQPIAEKFNEQFEKDLKTIKDNQSDAYKQQNPKYSEGSLSPAGTEFETQGVLDRRKQNQEDQFAPQGAISQYYQALKKQREKEQGKFRTGSLK